MADSENSNRWLLWGGALLGVVLLIAVGLFTLPTGNTGSQEQDEDTPSESPEPDQEAPAEEDNPEAGTCEDIEADSSFPTEAPDFEWEDFDGLEQYAVPVSEEHGPMVQEDGFWRCFSQTSSGAVFAAFNLDPSFLIGGHYEAAIDSPGAREALPDDLEEARDSANGLMRGFRVVESSDSNAIVEMWISPPDGSVDLVQQIDLTWDDDANDWRLDLAGNLRDVEELTNTSDFTEWE